MKLGPYRAPTNTGHHRTKLISWATWYPRYMPWCNYVWWLAKVFRSSLAKNTYIRERVETVR